MIVMQMTTSQRWRKVCHKLFIILIKKIEIVLMLMLTISKLVIKVRLLLNKRNWILINLTNPKVRIKVDSLQVWLTSDSL